MNNLMIIDHNGHKVIDSRQVAEMTEVRHSDLLEKIKGYIQYLENGEFRSQDFFIPNTYKTEGNNKTYDCFLITRKGCDMVANKMTGEKGVLFTAAYVTKFEEMEKQLKSPVPMSQLEIIAYSAQALLEHDKAIKQLTSDVQGIRDVVALNPNDWRKDTATLLNKMALKLGGYEHLKDIRAESYKLLDERFGVDLQCRLTNKRRRMADEGVCKSKRDKLNQLDVIADDKKLIEGYVAIIKEMAIKYGA
ncbi:Rha family transcriptional regulator [Sporomusa sphaeroides DSM 2875]|uniref:Rha family transcriptional regulator n=1 Tax=Sporomusa sphaeroides TaxID=47679 RepID=UPI0020307BC2|nr:Rha family transcriptional regulator [Sporomusa sphaeroides]MCM0758061.1 Rha family transcriptional regulator [Sporomusa sphaeroides DSM 2875]